MLLILPNALLPPGPGDKLELHDGSETSHKEFLKNPDSLCSTLIWEDEDDRTTWIYRYLTVFKFVSSCLVSES